MLAFMHAVNKRHLWNDPCIICFLKVRKYPVMYIVLFSLPCLHMKMMMLIMF